MNALMAIAGQEIRDGYRNKWIIAMTLLLAGFALTLTLLGSAPTGTVGTNSLLVTVVSLSSLTIFLIPLIALMLSYDAVIGEVERGTLLLLLSYPLARWHAIGGKFLGHLSVLAFATVVGYGSAGAVLVFQGVDADNANWFSFAAVIGSSVLLGAAFLAIGYLISTIVKERATAAGIAVAVWLLFVLIYDMALLGLLVADGGNGIGETVFNALLLANPTDAYRLFNLAGFEGMATFTGTIGLSANAEFSPLSLLGVQFGWIIVPLGLATWLFQRKEI
ncbi:MAG: ABC transporter permease [Alphaproteobacteria bacterium]|jgi:Cu-processing system permease protein|nr:ABC transporter permease [Alphaproteobacteria bacterium]MBT4086233.1 ABC transporter permease [Alphaproteobacteria bacterium]MBT4543850.1 ABC transporter permease [Alphaproteobacteria bacterium]